MAESLALSSPELAQRTDLFTLWNPEVPFPSHEEMLDLARVTHINLERAQRGGFHYLHESSVAWHKGDLHVVWANHPTHELNVEGELIRGTVSCDGGLTFAPTYLAVDATAHGAQSYNHPVIFSHQNKLWGFFTAWHDGKPGTALFQFNENSETWEPLGISIPNFLPFCSPQKLANGNWVIGGEDHWYESAVLISAGDDFTRWEKVIVPRSEGLEFLFPETALVDFGDRLVAICRPKKAGPALAAQSTDQGRTWTEHTASNFAMASAQPFSGTLSTGQHFLITCNHEEDRALLTIAVTRPGGQTFEAIWKIRHQHFPRRRLFGGWPSAEGFADQVGKTTEWSYPSAQEKDGQLYVSYTQGKEDCCLSIFPVAALAL